MSKKDQYTQQSTSKSILCLMLTAGSIGVHLISGMLVGVLFGYSIDFCLDSYPWFSGIGLLFGIIAGFRLIWIDTKKMIHKDPYE
ncbi:AtpZ/AtpI family protein [Lawsonia intracellularis]|uniref:AtpZ/AtpI family protein n=1 Tax=Lawsonia intracellularis TaxID=29546 RepID=UPI0009D9B435|nr:AtpZ/AtpI family protein [Lawsonia intracellularis]KAA0204509.1 ATP synthase subunit [Lawsonia intracellularis]MBZ3892939.1 AtpZ/AtpI family protein [Lawsonia intracellularis]RBN32906.1 ATP synthase subunit [Lawsonia intracellularis]RBN35272.1 ATP synthase subunit [Lawsonia intracellularis]RBN35468.1 ATP synthase subunit [Lawsonia intracellularis]